MTPWGLSDRTCVGLAARLALALGFVVLGGRRPGCGPGGGAAGPGGRRVGRADGAGLRLLGPRPLAGRGAAQPGAGPPEPREAGRRPRRSDGRRRWPAILGGWILVRGLHRTLGYRAAIWAGVCWFGCMAVIDRSGGLGARHDPRGGDPGGRSTGCWRRGGLGRRDSGPRWRSWPGGWPPLLLIGAGHPRHRPARLVLLAPAGAAAAGDGHRLVDRRHPGRLRRGLGLGADPAADQGPRRVAALRGVLLLGLPWTPFAAHRAGPIGPRRLAGRRPGLGQGLAPGVAGLRHRRDGRPGPRPGGADRRAGRAAGRRGGRPRFGLEADPGRRPPAAPSSPRSRRSWPPGSSP